MQIQRCHRESYFNVGFMDPTLVNQKNIRDQPKSTLDVIYKFLEQQNYKQYILLPYNFNYHWILLIIMIDQSNVIVFDSLRKPKDEYQDNQDMLNFIWKRFHKYHRGDFKEKLTFCTTFLVCMKFAHFVYSVTRIFHNLFFSLKCLRQEQGNNLCGYYVCEHIHHFVRDKVLSDHITMWKICEELLEKERLLAIQEALIGFLVDVVINLEGEFYYDGHLVVEPSNTTMGGS
uniref:Ubiquitin-like protease family profile domain-containing protein n=1 Tax=Setaria viridis TaxID=4556 RepID=A0A4U6T1S6_SETVI|nr:hypothetical protein SEVIR_9G291000v2 [Setaria viridis]